MLQLVARGLSTAEIGRELHIGDATVTTPLLRTYAELGVSDRTAAVTTALASGLLRRAVTRVRSERRGEPVAGAHLDGAAAIGHLYRVRTWCVLTPCRPSGSPRTPPPTRCSPATRWRC